MPGPPPQQLRPCRHRALGPLAATLAAAVMALGLLAPASALAWGPASHQAGGPEAGTRAAPPARVAQAQGQRVSIGSTLAAFANKALESGQDWVAWLAHKVGLRGSPQPTVNDLVAPVDGQITSVSIKGIALTNPGAPPPHTVPGGRDIHIVDLVPKPDGCSISGTPCTTVFVDHASAPFPFPDSGDPQQITTVRPLDFCVKKGDYLGFASEGGFVQGQYQNGVPFQVFSQVSGATTDFYTKHGDIMNGHSFAPQFAVSDLELLMQATEVTGDLQTTPCARVGDVLKDIPDNVLNNPTVGPDGSLTFVIPGLPAGTISGKAGLGPGGTTASSAARRLYARGSAMSTGSGSTVLKLKTTRKGKRAFRRRSSIPVSVHLAFRSSARLGSTTSSKDFRIKVKGKGKKH